MLGDISIHTNKYRVDVAEKDGPTRLGQTCQRCLLCENNVCHPETTISHTPQCCANKATKPMKPA